MTVAHVDLLQKARTALVEARRGMAKTLTTSGAKGANDAAQFTQIQEGIEAIDRAIKDEGELKA
jgi:hypothetical protein